MAVTVPTWVDDPTHTSAMSAANFNQLSTAATEVDARLISLITGTAAGPGVWLDSRLPSGTSTSAPANGASVSTWSDISGYGRHFTQATGANQPAYSTFPVGMTWTSTKHMSTPYPGAIMKQYYVVAKLSSSPSSGTHAALIGGTAAGQLGFSVFGPSSLVLLTDNTVVLANPSYTPGTADFHVYSFSYANPGAWDIRADGSQVATGTDTATIGSSLAIRVGNFSTGTSGWTGTIAAVLAYPVVHEDNTCFRIEKYLAETYGATFPGI